jgi:tetratricopeptide (TPR) repeat protein
MRRFLFAALAASIACASSAAADDGSTCSNPKTPPDAAIVVCTRLITLGTLGRADLANVYGFRGSAYASTGNRQRAIADYNEALRINPKHWGVLNGRGVAYQVTGQYDRAIADYDEAIRLNPKNWRGYANRGNTWRAKGEFGRAIADLDEALRLDPGRAENFTSRGGVKRENGDLDGAIADFDRAIKLDPKIPLPYTGRGLAWRAKGDLHRAIADLNQAIRTDPGYLAGYTSRGLAYESKGDIEQALADYRKAITLSPDRQYGSLRAVDSLATRARDTARARLTLLAAADQPAPQASVAKPAPPAAGAPVERDVGRRIALVIGNGAYANAGRLANPPNDARAVAKQLRDMGFETSDGIDLDRAGMKQRINDFLRGTATARLALFFYAGHGMQIDGKNYLVPVDARLSAASDLAADMADLDTILAGLDDQIRTNIVILDACRDNPLAQRVAVAADATRSLIVRSGLAAPSGLGAGATRGAGTLIAFATAPGQVALDGDGANSPFSSALVRHIGTPGLEVQQMLTRVRAEVVAATRNKQVPWSNSSLLGEVFLVSAKP